MGGNAEGECDSGFPHPLLPLHRRVPELRDRSAHLYPRGGEEIWARLVLAHQYLDQLTDEIRQSVFGNAGNLIAFRVGQADARILEDELGGDVKMGNLVSLGKYEFYARLLDQGRMREPFRGRTLPPIHGTARSRRAAVIRRSRERYGRPREEVEAKINRWLGA